MIQVTCNMNAIGQTWNENIWTATWPNKKNPELTTSINLVGGGTNIQSKQARVLNANRDRRLSPSAGVARGLDVSYAVEQWNRNCPNPSWIWDDCLLHAHHLRTAVVECTFILKSTSSGGDWQNALDNREFTVLTTEPKTLQFKGVRVCVCVCLTSQGVFKNSTVVWYYNAEQLVSTRLQDRCPYHSGRSCAHRSTLFDGVDLFCFLLKISRKQAFLDAKTRWSVHPPRAGLMYTGCWVSVSQPLRHGLACGHWSAKQKNGASI